MLKHKCCLAGIVVVAGSLSAPAPIQVPPGFVVDTLLDQIDGETPHLEAIRNPDYGDGVIAVSVNDGLLKVVRVSDSCVELLAAECGFPNVTVVFTARFDKTGLFGSDLYLTQTDRF